MSVQAIDGDQAHAQTRLGSWTCDRCEAVTTQLTIVGGEKLCARCRWDREMIVVSGSPETAVAARGKSARLHPTAEAVYRYIIRYKRQHAGESPTRREIGAGVGISTPSIVHHHLMMLERAGKIVLARPSGKARMIAIPGAEWRFEEVRFEGNGENKCAVIDSDGMGPDSL